MATTLYALNEQDRDFLSTLRQRDLSPPKVNSQRPPRRPLTEIRIGKIYGADIAPGDFVGEAKLWTWDADAEEWIEGDDDPVACYDFMGSGVPEEMPVHLVRLGIFENALWLIQWPMRLMGVLESNLSVGSTATVGVWRWNGSAWEDTGMDITARDRLMPTGASNIAIGRWVEIEWFADGQIWIVTNAMCPDISPPP